jgi:hypothetical protein
MSATKEAQGDLVPLSAKVVQWVYGDPDYVRSVFGKEISRADLEMYYQSAKTDWTELTGIEEGLRFDIHSWLRSVDIRGLDYYYPVGFKTIWFKKPEDAFAFKLKFGEK